MVPILESLAKEVCEDRLHPIEGPGPPFDDRIDEGITISTLANLDIGLLVEESLDSKIALECSQSVSLKR